MTRYFSCAQLFADSLLPLPTTLIDLPKLLTNFHCPLFPLLSTRNARTVVYYELRYIVPNIDTFEYAKGNNSQITCAAHHLFPSVPELWTILLKNLCHHSD